MMLRFFCIISILTVLSTACLRLDSNMYNPTQLDAYLFNNYQGTELGGNIPDSTRIADSMVQELVLTSDENGNLADIYAVYIGDVNRISTDTVILYCHGNASNMDGYWYRAQLLANAGHKHRFGVLMMDYRGYGRSEGYPYEAGLYADVDACMKWLENNGLTGDRLVIYGFSLGTGPATELTANPRTLQPAQLILEAPYASVNKIQQDGAFISMPQSYFTDLELDNAEEIKKVEEPFLWIHGEDDAFLSIEHGEIISKNYNGQHKVERRVPGGGHSDVPLIMGFNEYMQLVADFIQGAI